MNVVVSYQRVSGKGQVDGDGFERQGKSIAAFCAANKLALPERDFIEKGVSGTTEGIDRPEFSRALDYLRHAKITHGTQANYVIVVERMDRLARDLMVSEMLLRECREQGIKIFSADQGSLIDMATNEGDPTRKLIRQLMGALAEWEKSVLVRKLRISRERIRATGAPCEGRKHYGEKPGEIFILNQMVALWSEHKNYSRVTKILNEMGLLNRSGKPWKEQNVRTVLVNYNKQQQKNS